VRTLLLGLKQTCILDGDHSLIGEGRGQLDLLIGKWAYLIAKEREDANRRPEFVLLLVVPGALVILLAALHGTRET
jgi:hypothetical protein